MLLICLLTSITELATNKERNGAEYNELQCTFKKKINTRLQKDSQSFGKKPAPDHAGVTRLLLALELGLG